MDDTPRETFPGTWEAWEIYNIFRSPFQQQYAAGRVATKTPEQTVGPSTTEE